MLIDIKKKDANCILSRLGVINSFGNRFTVVMKLALELIDFFIGIKGLFLELAINLIFQYFV